MKKPKIEPEQAAEVPALSLVRKRRRPVLWVASILLIAIAALLAGAVVNQIRDTVPVLAMSRDVARGAVITDGDLTTVEVHPDPALRMIDATSRDEVVGQLAMIDLPAGSLVVPGATGSEVQMPEGQVMVGVALTPPQMPAGQLKPGQVVQLVSTPRTGDDVTDDTPAVSIEATVVATTTVPDTNLVVVNVHVGAAQAERAAQLSASGRVALIVKGI